MPFGNKYLPGETLFRTYWLEMGDARSCSKLARWAKSNNIRDENGNPPTPMGAWKSMWRWALTNPDTSLKIFNEARYTTGRPVYSRSQWIKELDEKVDTAWQSKNFSNRWRIRHAN